MKGEKEFHLVYCVLKKTTEPEGKYHSSRLELLAIVWSINRLRAFLLRIKFTVITDCQALTWLKDKKTLNPQMARWFNDLCEYDFEIRYRAGEKMTHVDALSRAPVDDEIRSTNSAGCLHEFGMYIAMTEHDRIVLIQRGDEHLRKLIAVLQKAEKERTREERESVENCVLDDGRLYQEVKKCGKTKRLYVIPCSLRKSVVIKFHDLNGISDWVEQWRLSEKAIGSRGCGGMLNNTSAVALSVYF